MIRVTYSTIDGVRKVRTFKTLKGARAFAQHWIGHHVDFGSFYAVSFDGVDRIICSGCMLADLFPSQES